VSVVKQVEMYENELVKEKLLKPKKYEYPDHDQPTAIFDFEDLENEEAMLVLCVRADPEDTSGFKQQHSCFVWRGPDFDIESHPENASLSEWQFIQKCIDNYWGDQASQLQIQVLYEDSDNTSDAFNQFFGLD